MNPQYLPPQQIGGPQQGFQNVPLGPAKPGHLPHQGDFSSNNFTSSQARGDHPQLPSMSQIPQSQLPPSLGQSLSSQQNSGPPMKSDMPFSNIQNGHMTVSSAPMDQQNRQPFAPQNVSGSQTPNQYGPTHTSTPNIPSRPISHQPNQMPTDPKQVTSNFGPPSANTNMHVPPRPPSNQPMQMGQPPSLGGPLIGPAQHKTSPSQFEPRPNSAQSGPPPVSSGQSLPTEQGHSNVPPSIQPTQSGQPPFLAGPLSGPQHQGGPPSQMSSGGPPPQQNQFGQPPMGPISRIPGQGGSLPGQRTLSNQPGQAPLGNNQQNPHQYVSGPYPPGGPQMPPGGQHMPPGGPRMAPRGPQMQPGGPQMPPGGPQMPPGGPQMQPGGLHMPPGGPQMQLGGPQKQPSEPRVPHGGPQMQPGGPQMAPGGSQMQPGGPNMPPGGHQMQPGGPNMPPGGPNMPPGGPQMPPGGHQMQPGGPNMPPGGPQMPPGGPPMVPGGPQMFPGGPPLPNKSQFGPGQLNNQMQGMHLGGPRQYPSGLIKNAINGDGGPHMPPPLSQTGYVNGQQMRVPGYPPMPGQGSMPMPGQMPGQGQMPMPGQMPGQGQMPMPGQMPGQGQMPMPGQMPGQGQMPGHGQMPGQPGFAGGPGAYPQQNRRLDPDQMPSPIQVTQDDQENRSGVFVTNQKGLVPPLVTTNFVVQDQGNASPRFMRSTMYNVPITQDILKQTAVPFSLVISPMARQVDQEYPPPIVNFGELGPVRCIRCKAYMCPFMQFVDSGRRFQCLFCMATTDVPTEYFQHLDHTGQRMDRMERPELVLGAYEFAATADYCRNNRLPLPPAVIFVIDVSYNSVKSGMVALLCKRMRDIVRQLPVDQGRDKSNMRVGFITYNSTVHFYNIKGTLAAPQMMVVGDVHEMFMPLLDGFLCTPEESEAVIDSLMEQIPAMFGDTRETEVVLLPAIQAGLEALKASDCAGKLLVLTSTLPSADAPGKLKSRDDRKVLGTDKERSVLTPQSQAYNQLGQECVGAGCSVDLFVLNNSYIDVATIGQVARLTGGEVFKYTYFQADVDGERLINDIITDISRPIAFDGIMRVRTSTGVRPTDFYGHFFMSNTTDIELASIDCDKAIAVEIKHDDKLSEESGVYIQAALLYTSCSGQRRLRILNLSLKTCSQMADLYRSCDLDTLVNYIAKQSVYKLLDNNPKAVKDAIVNRAAQILATYRKHCASPSSAGQLILPECMKLLPLYANCLLKSDALSGGADMTVDDRSFAMQVVMTMDVPASVHHFYPRLVPVHGVGLEGEEGGMPAPIRCTAEKMSDQGVYILENGIHMFLWFGLNVSPEFTQKVFGAPSAIQVDVDRIGLPELDNPLSLAVRSIIDQIRTQRHRCMRVTLVRQREKLEPVFKHFLVEDRGNDSSPSYVDFLCHMHKEIRTILS